jgi:hypothetical protein
MLISAAICSLVLGFGFGLPAIFGTLHFAQTGEVWTFLGFPTYGGGPFERLGMETSVPPLIGFVLVCLVEVSVGLMLMRGVPHAASRRQAVAPTSDPAHP